MQDGPFPKWWSSGYNRLTPFQCTWWAWGRASRFLEENNIAEKYPSDAQNGGGYYSENVENGWFNYGKTPKVNSLVCWGWASRNSTTHVAYVEGVTDEGIYVSHAGSGSGWFGVKFYENAIYKELEPNGYIYLDDPLKTLK